MVRPADIGGEIHLRLATAEGRIGSVQIASTRPTDAARVFEGAAAETMCATIGRVFSLCGTAQTVAALGAVEMAQAYPDDPVVTAARDAARQAEIFTQVVTRLALHWPRALGLPFAPEAVRAAMATERQIEAQVLGAGWRRPGAGVNGPAEADLAPCVDIDRLVAPLATALADHGYMAYGALPAGRSPECGVLETYWEAPAVVAARHAHGAGLAARLAAAQVALETLPGAIRNNLAACRTRAARAATRPGGEGRATVATARGPLTHRVHVNGGVVTLCRTEAPTDANFAEDGPVAAGLLKSAADAVAAELHVLAIDPCVAARVDLAPG